MNKESRITRLEREIRALRNVLKDYGIIKVDEGLDTVFVFRSDFTTLPERFDSIQSEFNDIGDQITDLRFRVTKLEPKL